MCGRFAVYTEPRELADYFSATLTYEIELSYNVAPTRTVPALITHENERMIVPMRWGLIPSWYKEGSKLAMLNNARGETVDSKPSFRHSFRHQRCLILTDGFYEWDAEKTPKQPYYIPMKNREPFGLTGLWAHWMSNEKTIDSCCIITMQANDVVSPIHDRMPSIMPKELIDTWLDPNFQDVSKLKKMLENTHACDNLAPFPVSTRVNKANFDDAQCIQPL